VSREFGAVRVGERRDAPRRERSRRIGGRAALDRLLDDGLTLLNR
jgi:hypothetical protein